MHAGIKLIKDKISNFDKLNNKQTRTGCKYNDKRFNKNKNNPIFLSVED